MSLKVTMQVGKEHFFMQKMVRVVLLCPATFDENKLILHK